MKDEPVAIKSAYLISPKRSQKMSRYGRLKRLVDEEDMTYIETPNKFTIKESSNDTFYAVEKGYENRLDLISYKFYGSVFLWWAIAAMNNIKNPMKVDAGIVLRIPAMSTLYDSGGVLSANKGEM
jgi:nucleoid-associated protein YgaU